MSRAIAKAGLRSDQPHPLLDQLDLALETQNAGDDCLDVSYMSRSFCLSGLPLRRQFLKDPSTGKVLEPRQEETVFSRTDGAVSLTIGSQPFVMPDKTRVTVGVPYGARARLLILWLTTQARATQSRFLEIGRIEDWLNDAGIAFNPDSVSSAKEQLIRLSFANFTMVMKQDDYEFFTADRLIDKAVFQKDDIVNAKNGKFASVRLPLGVELSSKAYERFTGQGVIPVSTEALRKISHNAMAIDIFLYLSYKLPLISLGDTELLSWSRLVNQFGNGETKSRFRQNFDPSISQALSAYRGANVDITKEGLVLRYSDPVEVRKMFVVSGGAKKEVRTLQRVRNRILPPPAKSKDEPLGGASTTPKQLKMDV